jgi:hypothetical protein
MKTKITFVLLQEQCGHDFFVEFMVLKIVLVVKYSY